MNENKIILPIIVKNIRGRVDRSASITIETNELSDMEFLIFRNLMGHACYCHIKDSQIEAPEYDLVNECDEFEEKSEGKRLYDRMFVCWDKKYKERYTNFNEWRKMQMEKIGQKYLDKINEI